MEDGQQPPQQQPNSNVVAASSKSTRKPRRPASNYNNQVFKWSLNSTSSSSNSSSISNNDVPRRRSKSVSPHSRHQLHASLGAQQHVRSMNNTQINNNINESDTRHRSAITAYTGHSTPEVPAELREQQQQQPQLDRMPEASAHGTSPGSSTASRASCSAFAPLSQAETKGRIEFIVNNNSGEASPNSSNLPIPFSGAPASTSSNPSASRVTMKRRSNSTGNMMDNVATMSSIILTNSAAPKPPSIAYASSSEPTSLTDRFRTAFLNSPIPLLIIDAGSGRIADLNRSFVSVLGFDQRQPHHTTPAPITAAASCIGKQHPTIDSFVGAPAERVIFPQDCRALLMYAQQCSHHPSSPLSPADDNCDCCIHHHGAIAAAFNKCGWLRVLSRSQWTSTAPNSSSSSSAFLGNYQRTFYRSVEARFRFTRSRCWGPNSSNDNLMKIATTHSPCCTSAWVTMLSIMHNNTSFILVELLYSSFSTPTPPDVSPALR